jgi:hypothetical protein
MSVFSSRYRKMIVEVAHDLMAGSRTAEGATDKERLETEIREHLFSNLPLKEWYQLKDEALRFTIYEYVNCTIRNTKPGGRTKERGEEGEAA